MYREYDVVVATKALDGVAQNSLGTILIVHEDGKNYVVEFLDEEGNTLNVLPVSEADIAPWTG